MSKKEHEEDIVQRINLEKIADDDGEWIDAPDDERVIMQSAIFQSFFNYINMAAEDAKLNADFEISPEKIISAMMKRTEIEVVDALIKSYNKRNYDDDKD
tara:strand:- start:2578 stop:2877 length:300 start_codon:yes stop_codon:yes gene_type:complete